MKRRFKWYVNIGYKGLMLNDYYLSEDFDLVSQYLIDKHVQQPLIFDKKKDAREFMETLIEDVRCYVKHLVEDTLASNTVDEISDVCDIFIDKIKHDTKEKSDYYLDLVYDMILNDSIFEGIYELNNCKYKIVKRMVRSVED